MAIIIHEVWVIEEVENKRRILVWFHVKRAEIRADITTRLIMFG